MDYKSLVDSSYHSHCKMQEEDNSLIGVRRISKTRARSDLFSMVSEDETLILTKEDVQDLEPC